MRFSENKIKAAILDNDLEIRQRAIRYFSKSYSTDRSVMPLVIEAVETFGRQDAYHLIGLSRDLPQTEETIAWIIDELNIEESDQHENYSLGENSTWRVWNCGTSWWKPAPSWGSGFQNTTSGWQPRRLRRQNIGDGSTNLRAIQTACCCSPLRR